MRVSSRATGNGNGQGPGDTGPWIASKDSNWILRRIDVGQATTVRKDLINIAAREVAIALTQSIILTLTRTGTVIIGSLTSTMILSVVANLKPIPNASKSLISDLYTETSFLLSETRIAYSELNDLSSISMNYLPRKTEPQHFGGGPKALTKKNRNEELLRRFLMSLLLEIPMLGPFLARLCIPLYCDIQ